MRQFLRTSDLGHAVETTSNNSNFQQQQKKIIFHSCLLYSPQIGSALSYTFITSWYAMGRKFCPIVEKRGGFGQATA